jgi:hypothetical protein
MKRERDPTPEEFEEFLAWLDSDRDEAGCKFGRIQTRLIQVFISRGCIDAEVLADEVVNRVTVRIEKVKENYMDPIRCCVGFVDNVHREYLRDERRKSDAVWPPSTPGSTDELEREDACLNECLDRLERSERELVKRYFEGEKQVRISGRQKLAVERGLTPNALRLQAHKLRKNLRLCLRTCLDQAEAETIRP